MQTIVNIISEYGLLSYAILFLYCALKSGSLPLFAGIAAHLGALNLFWVATAVFLGGYLGDELRFYVGRRYGVANLSSRPSYQKAVVNAKLLLDRFGKSYIFLYRYPKGMRTIGSLPVALTDMSWSVFTRLNFASAITWTFALVGSGYVFGSALEHLIGDNWALFSVVLLAVFLLMTYAAWRHVTFLARETLHRKTSSQSAKQ